ncbi:MAG: hypothetical protein OHK0029_03160 [Armatimonadaceae bacterium]
MITSLIKQWNCRRYTPLLTAYCEEALDEHRMERVAAHIEECPQCQEEIASLMALSQTLRAYPPPVPELSTNLWARIQADIEAEAPREPVPQTPQQAPRTAPQPFPVLPHGSYRNGFQWTSFGSSFAGAGAVVAVVVFGVVLATQPLLKRAKTEQAFFAQPRAAESMVLNNPEPERSAADQVTIEIRSPLAQTTAQAAAIPMNPEKALTKADQKLTPARKPELATVRATYRARPAEQSRAIRTTSSDRIVSLSSLPVRRDSAAMAVASRGAAGKTAAGSSLSGAIKAVTVVAAPVAEARESEVRPQLRMASRPVPMGQPEVSRYSLSEDALSSLNDSERLAIDSTTEASGFRQVADASIAPRDVPAITSVSDVAVRFQARQILFSYGAR